MFHVDVKRLDVTRPGWLASRSGGPEKALQRFCGSFKALSNVHVNSLRRTQYFVRLGDSRQGVYLHCLFKAIVIVSEAWGYPYLL